MWNRELMHKVEKMYVLKRADDLRTWFGDQYIAIHGTQVLSAGHDKDAVQKAGERFAKRTDVLVGTVDELVEEAKAMQKTTRGQTKRIEVD